MKIQTPIQLELKSFSIADAEKKLIEQCIIIYPYKTIRELASLLKLSDRTLYRKIQAYKISREKIKERMTIESAKDFLESRNFIVKEP